MSDAWCFPQDFIRHSGASRSDEPGISRFRVRGFASPRNDRGLRRPNPVAMKTVGHAMPELHQRHRTCLDIAGIEHRKIAAVFAPAPDRRQQPAIAFGGILAALDEYRLRNGVAGGKEIVAKPRSLAVDMHDARQRAEHW